MSDQEIQTAPATMQVHLDILRARRSVLSKALPPRTSPPSTPWCQDDPFAFESRGFYLPTDGHGKSLPMATSKSNKKKRKGKLNASLVDNGGIRKSEKNETRKRSSPIWTAYMDRFVRKSLRKWGWGSWTRMERTNKLPPEYTAKVIARRVKALGYTRENFSMAGEKAAAESAKVRKHFS